MQLLILRQIKLLLTQRNPFPLRQRGGGGTATHLPVVSVPIKNPAFARFKFGPDKDRTCDLLHAMQALSQLSYGPDYVYSIAIFFAFANFLFSIV